MMLLAQSHVDHTPRSRRPGGHAAAEVTMWPSALVGRPWRRLEWHRDTSLSTEVLGATRARCRHVVKLRVGDIDISRQACLIE